MADMSADLPIVAGPFVVPVSKVGGHDIRVTVEGPASHGRSEGRDVLRPWLRAGCSCGWSSAHRFTIEDNAWHDWTQHIDGPDDDEGDDG